MLSLDDRSSPSAGGAGEPATLGAERSGPDALLRTSRTRSPYEFGVRGSVARAHHHGLMVGARSFPGNPYDGHMLAEQLEQATMLTEDTGAKPKKVVVELGFRGVGAHKPDVEIIQRGSSRAQGISSGAGSGDVRRRSWPSGRLKHGNGMDRCWVQGVAGDVLHAVLRAACYTVRWLLRAVVRLGLGGFIARLFALLEIFLTALENAVVAGTTDKARTASVVV